MKVEKREQILKEKEKIRNLKTGSAITYIWDYYKIPIICIMIAISLMFYFANIFLHQDSDEILNIQFVNYYDDVSRTSHFAENFNDFIGARASEGRIVFDNYVFFNLENSSDYNNSYYQKTIAYLEAGTADGIICSYDNLMGIAQSGRLMDLHDERTRAIYEKYADRVVNIEIDGERIPVGIDVSDSSLLNSADGYAGNCYIGISSHVNHVELLEMFVEYLLKD